MLKSLLLTLVATVVLAAGYPRQENGSLSSSKVVVSLPKTSPVDGKQMYMNYCAPCHGSDGRGYGPVAATLKTPPTNLTVMSKSNGGKFPAAHLTAVLDFGSEVPAHGTAEMPVWGPILAKMDQGSRQQRDLRISNLGRYLRQIQTP